MIDLGRQPVARRVLLWFGLLAAPAAWGLQHWIGISLVVVACGEATAGDFGAAGSLPLHGLSIALAVVAALVAVAGLLASILVYRATRDAGDEPPDSRVRFLAVMGMTISPLLLCIILLSGFGVSLLDGCRQG